MRIKNQWTEKKRNHKESNSTIYNVEYTQDN